MVDSLSGAVSEFKRNWSEVFCPVKLNEACRDAGLQWRDRVLDPVTVIRLFLLQILHGNTAITHLRFFLPKSFSASAYCQARARVPLEVFKLLLKKMSINVRRTERSEERWRGRRVYLVDGSSFSMPDTPELQQHFGQPRGQKEGCGFPMASFVALIHSGTGIITEVLSTALFTHDLPQAVKLHPALSKDDVVVGDRGFCSYAHICLMARRGVDAMFRIHQNQIVSFRYRRRHAAASKGIPRSRWERRLGVKDQIVTWFKPPSSPSWMSKNQFRLLPAELSVRELCYNISKKGFRTQEVRLVTTLLDENEFSREALAELYGVRWSIETNFRHLKTTLGMDMLRCRSVQGVLKEFYAFCIVYNLVRATMLHAANVQRQPVERISFIDAWRWLVQSCHRRLSHSLLVLPSRPGRREPRAIKRRPKQYDRLNKPRKMYADRAA